jgi:hypothetical protein
MPNPATQHEPSPFAGISMDIQLPGMPMETTMDYLGTLNREVAIRQNRIKGLEKNHQPIPAEETIRLESLKRVQAFVSSIRTRYPTMSEVMNSPK